MQLENSYTSNSSPHVIMAVTNTVISIITSMFFSLSLAHSLVLSNAATPLSMASKTLSKLLLFNQFRIWGQEHCVN